MTSRDYLESEFIFEELEIAVSGRFLPETFFDGKATLSGDEDGYSVVHIELRTGIKLVKTNWGAHDGLFEDLLFRRIAAVIENPKTEIGKRASSEWADVVEDAMEAA